MTQWGDVADPAGYRLGSDPDDTLSFVRAAASGKPIRFTGNKQVTSLPELPTTCPGIRGTGKHSSRILITSASGAGLSLAPFSDKTEIGGFTLSRSGTATSGADGITAKTSCNNIKINDMIVEGHYRGLVLCPTGNSEIEIVTVQKAVSHGVFLQNTSSDTALQWGLDRVLSQMCGGDAFRIEAVRGPLNAAVALSEWSNVEAFGATGYGLVVEGLPADVPNSLPTVPVHGLRLRGGFLGSCGNSLVRLNTYGYRHSIVGVHVELAGRTTTGVALTTPASGVGSGFEITANNTRAFLTSCIAEANAYDGFDLAAASQSLGDCESFDNGNALTSSRRNGIRHTAGRLHISSGFYGGLNGQNTQQYGLMSYDLTQVKMDSAIDWTGNSVADTIDV